MRIGVCACYEKAAILQKCGFDYFEYNLVGLYGLSHGEFLQAEAMLNRLGFYSEVMGIMLPPHIGIVGRKIDLQTALDYLNVALDRAQLLGCRMITFGASHSRNMPKGFSDRKLAYDQIVRFLEILSENLDKRGMSLVIEPCPIHENNILTFISEAYYIMDRVKRENVKIMADTYTMQFASEKYGNLVTYADDIAHMHLSSPDRGFPYLDDNHDYSGLFKTLADIGYNKTLTIEAFHPDNFEEGAEKTYAFLVENMKKCGLTRE